MSFSYNISLSGLNAAKNALKVTQNNISNVDTQGYARQRVNLEVQDTLTGAGVSGQIGNGVQTVNIERVKDELLIQQVRNQLTRVSYYQAMESGLTNIESIMGELSKGSLTNVMQDFFNSWEELSKYPTENAYRESVAGLAQQLSFKFNTVTEDLRLYRSELDKSIEVDVTRANDLIKQLANVNQKILDAGINTPNGLLDKRDGYIEELASIGNVRLMYNSENENVVDVEFGGMLVVSGTTTQNVKGLYDEQGDNWVLAVGNMPLRLNQGSLSSHLEVRNDYIPKATAKLDEMAAAIITSVNDLHQNAFALDGTTGHRFFAGTNANTMAVHPDILQNANNIAISDTANEKGNANVARQLADLQNAGIMLSGKNPLEDWTGYVVSLGQQALSVGNSADVYENVLNDLKSQRQSIQGVDIDEELALLMQYEKYYQSNAKALQYIDKSFSTILDML